jgi:hypothetical protein
VTAVRLVQYVERRTVNWRPGVNSQTAQVTFVVIDHEILSTAIRTVPLLWYVHTFHFLAKGKATSTGKLLDSLCRKDAVAEMCSDKFNVSYCHDLQWKLLTPPPRNIFCFTCYWRKIAFKGSSLLMFTGSTSMYCDLYAIKYVYGPITVQNFRSFARSFFY